MPSLKVTLQIERDGRALPGFPLMRRLEVDELAEFEFEKANDGNAITFSALPTSELSEIQVLLVRMAANEMTLRLDGQSDAGITLRSGALLLVLDADIDASASTNARINNNSGSAGLVRGLAGGT